MKALLIQARSDAPSSQLCELVDSRFTCTIVATENEGFDAYCAAVRDGRPFDLILVDVALPSVDGYKLLSAVRAHESVQEGPEREGAPVVLVGGEAQTVSPVWLSALGATRFSSPPLSPEELRSAIEEFVVGSRKASR